MAHESKPPNLSLKAALNSLVSVFFPATCVLCKTIVEDLSQALVCRKCWNQVVPFQGEVCSRCGYAFASLNLQVLSPLCGSCRRDYFQFDFARSYSNFQDPLKEIIHQFKYRAHPSLARPLAGLLFSVYRSHLQEFSSDVVAPVPLHKSRERERGFNQSLLLARTFSHLADLPLRPCLLARRRATQIQAGLSRRARRLNLAGAFSLLQKGEVTGKSILLIDDVFTTGATVNECARLLKGNGAQRVNVLTLARVIHG